MSLSWRQCLAVAGLAALVAVLAYAALSGAFQALSYQLLSWQRDLHRALTLTITELSQTPSAATWMMLIGVSFGYGVFHAAGPGHGKAVLATYLASHGGATRRALGLSFAASMLQGVTAIALVVVLVHALGWVTRQAMGSVTVVEQASFLLVALLGVWLCVRAFKQLNAAYRLPVAQVRDHLHNHEFHHVHAHTPHHDHQHDGACGCGNAHHIAPAHALDWRTAIMTVISIGMRPCSGAVLMLGAASLLGQFMLGVAAVVAMSLGTGLTVSALALATVLARDWAKRRLVSQRQRQRGQKLAGWLALTGGVVIVALGVSLSLTGAAQPGGMPLLNEPATQQESNPLRG
ncbi:nickel/cobalt transporter [Halomonas llamarensis]|uniref:Nickel/cobalt efflux system n=1 Tax=Halomonas llamarensis TaxID=2945104 RepID=A0ABT0SLU0_9GAMM|nr:nickel/cobalt transporter [Halomonas llamarensis]MCL7928543.1 nickel/cobalt transporter [Halomonas llamarensis]